jgi:hypothetical protein
MSAHHTDTLVHHEYTHSQGASARPCPRVDYREVADPAESRPFKVRCCELTPLLNPVLSPVLEAPGGSA